MAADAVCISLPCSHNGVEVSMLWEIEVHHASEARCSIVRLIVYVGIVKVSGHIEFVVPFSGRVVRMLLSPSVESPVARLAELCPSVDVDIFHDVASHAIDAELLNPRCNPVYHIVSRSFVCIFSQRDSRRVHPCVVALPFRFPFSFQEFGQFHLIGFLCLYVRQREQRHG